MDVIHFRKFRLYYIFLGSSEAPHISALWRNPGAGAYEFTGRLATDEPISAMTTVVSKTRAYWFFFSMDSTNNDYLIVSLNNPSSDHLKVFILEEGGINNLMNDASSIKPPKLTSEIYIKMTAVFNELNQALIIYSITATGKLV